MLTATEIQTQMEAAMPRIGAAYREIYRLFDEAYAPALRNMYRIVRTHANRKKWVRRYARS